MHIHSSYHDFEPSYGLFGRHYPKPTQPHKVEYYNQCKPSPYRDEQGQLSFALILSKDEPPIATAQPGPSNGTIPISSPQSKPPDPQIKSNLDPNEATMVVDLLSLCIEVPSATESMVTKASHVEREVSSSSN